MRGIRLLSDCYCGRLFKSSINRRPRVKVPPAAEAAADVRERAALLPLWRVAAKPAEDWAAAFLGRRLG